MSMVTIPSLGIPTLRARDEAMDWKETRGSVVDFLTNLLIQY